MKMNTKNNQRTRLSKIMFKNAMMDLLREKHTIEKISVKELCERAELNRSTFYAHYNEPKDLYEEICNDILESTRKHLIKIAEENDAGAHKYILSFLQYIKQNDNQFRTLLISTNTEFRTRFMQQSVMQFINNLHIAFPNELEQYIYSYILNGSAGIIVQWIRSDYSLKEEHIVDLLFLINKSAIENLADTIR